MTVFGAEHADDVGALRRRPEKLRRSSLHDGVLPFLQNLSKAKKRHGTVIGSSSASHTLFGGSRAATIDVGMPSVRSDLVAIVCRLLNVVWLDLLLF